MYRYIAALAFFSLPLSTACVAGSGDQIADEGEGQEQDVTGQTKYHYTPNVHDVHFTGGCGVVSDPPQKDCSYGFALNYTRSYADLKTTVSHTTDNTKHTVRIKLDTWSTGKYHIMLAVGPQTDSIGMLDAKAGQTYTVTVVDRKDNVLWTGKVMALYHL